MQPSVIVETHPVHHRLPGLLTGGEPLTMHTGRFQTAPEAFRRCVIPAVALPAHRGTHLPILQGTLELMTAILAASVAVEYQP